MKFRLLSFTCIIGLIVFGSCTSEPKDPPLMIADVLPGYWELITATRNDRPVPSLEGIYFEFDSLGTVSTNFTGDQVVTEFNIVDSSIIYSHAGNNSKFDFKINGIDTIMLTTKMRKIFTFELLFSRAEKE